MTATDTLIEPAENAEILWACASARAVNRRKAPAEWEERERDVILCVERHRLLVVMDDDTPRVVPGPEGPLVLAFTDDDAAQAWACSRHPSDDGSAVVAPSAASPPRSAREGRRWWQEWLADVGAVAMRVNTAGPSGFTVFASDLEQVRPRLRVRSISAPAQTESWLDVDGRAAARERVRALRAEYREAFNHGDHERAEGLWDEVRASSRFGDGLWAAELQLLDARRRLRDGDEMHGASQQLFGSIGYGRFGDPYRSVDGLLETGEMLLEMRARGVTDPQKPGFVAEFLTQTTAALRRTGVDYREAEVTALLARSEP